MNRNRNFKSSVFSLSVRNDASFIIGTDMNFYEHQSTYNPNMPMRSLIYCTDAIDRRIKEKNENLYGYTFFVNRVNANKESGMELEQAIDEAIDTCTREDILQDFFRTYKNEVRRIMALDFTFERQIELTKMEYYQDGFAAGPRKNLLRSMRRPKSLRSL